MTSYTGIEGASREVALDNLKVTRNGVVSTVTSIVAGEYVRAILVPEDTTGTPLSYDLTHAGNGTWSAEITLPDVGVYSIVWSTFIGGAYEEWSSGLLVQSSAAP